VINKPLQEIGEIDLQNLIANKVLEGKHLEYKQDLSIAKDSDKKEFLADVSSFANALGGDLIFGIQSDGIGQPEKLDGILVPNEDSELLRIEEILRTGIAPKISALQPKFVRLTNQRTALIIRVPQSWNSPHMVVYQGTNKFYTRATNGKYLMDVSDLRNSFALNESISEKIKNFRLERIGRVFSGDAYLDFPRDTGVVILHIIPFSAFQPQQNSSLQFVKEHWKEIKPMLVGGWDHRYNIDGYMGFKSSESYVEIFREGMIEAADANILRSYTGEKVIPSKVLEDALIDSLSNYLKVMDRHGIGAPASISVSLVNIQDYFFAGSRYSFDATMGRRITLKQRVVNLPENVILDFGIDSSIVLKPIFDALWNAYGFKSSENYNDKGVRIR
jgi:hypothetical protein